MATIVEPASTRPIAVTKGQWLRLEADTATNWFRRHNGGSWTQVGTNVQTLVTEATADPTSPQRFTFDALQIGVGASSSSIDDTVDFNVCEGPPTVLLLTPAIRNEAMDPPVAQPSSAERDDPPLEVPLAMPGAKRDGFGTVLLESPSDPGGPANLISDTGPGVFVDVAGKLGVRTPIVPAPRGLGPFPAIASYYYTGFYFNHDFGKSRSLGLARIVYRESAGGASHYAIVRGDGRRNTYRALPLSAPQAAASLQNVFASGTETLPSGTVFHYESNEPYKLQKIIDRCGNTVYYAYDGNQRLQKIQGIPGASGLVSYLAYDGSGLCSLLVLEDAAAPANNRTSYFHYDGSRNLTKIIGPELCITYYEYNEPDYLSAVTDPEGYRWYFAYDASKRVERTRRRLRAA